MLDFIIMSTTPSKEDLVGSISLKEYDVLSEIWEACEKKGIIISFFSDTRLNALEVEEVLCIFKAKREKCKPHKMFNIEKMISILEKGIRYGKGMLVVCD